MTKFSRIDQLKNTSVPQPFNGHYQEFLKVCDVIQNTTEIINENKNSISTQLIKRFGIIEDEFIALISLLIDRDTTNYSFPSIFDSFNKFVEQFYNYNDSAHGQNSGGFYICQSIKSSIFSASTKEASLDNALVRVTELEEKIKSLHDELYKKAQEEVVKNYAQIFEDDANENKSTSKNWLAAIIFLVVCFVLFIFIEDRILPLSESANSTIVALSYVKRLLIISFLLYIITFCVKQYNVKMHLSTLNKHRSNTLSSYKLFIQSMGDSDAETRSQLMREVSKSIYDAGQTGYISLKDDNDNSTSTVINEVTKFIKPTDK